MYKLTAHIPSNNEQLPIQQFIDMYNGIQWGKARRVDENTFGFVQSPVTCKDYVVDTYYRVSYGFNPALWTEEQRYAPLIYIVFQSKDRYTHFLKMVKEVLNPWEIKQGVKPCVVYEACYEPLKHYPWAVIEYDTCWMNNATAMSIYYSLLRICTANDNLSFKRTDKKNLWNCNEFSYYDNNPSWAQKILDDVLVDVTPYLIVPEDPYKNHGYKMPPSHGQTGLFFMLGQISYYRMQLAASMRQSNIFYQHIFKKYIDIPAVAEAAPKAAEPRRRNMLGQYV